MGKVQQLVLYLLLGVVFMQQKRGLSEPKVKLRWLILLPLIAFLLFTVSLMVKEYKDQKVRNEAQVSYFYSEQLFM